MTVSKRATLEQYTDSEK